MKRMKNELRRVTVGCKSISYKWRVNANKTKSKV